jgi:hypothetical protein
MRKNLNALLAAASAVALVASPAVAKSYRSQASVENVLNGARGSAALHDYYGTYRLPANEGGPYTPSVPTPPHGENPDFQDSTR